jgi:hypothetical protein
MEWWFGKDQGSENDAKLGRFNKRRNFYGDAFSKK